MIRYSSKLSEKGQVVIPAQLQRQMDLASGEVVQVQSEESMIVIEQIPGWVEATRGTLATNHAQLEPDQLEALIEATAIIESFQAFGKLG